MKIPNSTDIKQLLDGVKKAMPSLKGIIETFNKTNIKVKDMTSFTLTFPMVVTSINAAANEMASFNISSDTMEKIRNAENALLLRDENGKFVQDDKGNKMTIFDPFNSMIAFMSNFTEKVGLKTIIQLRAKIFMTKIVFKNILKMIAELVDNNSDLLKKLVEDKYIKRSAEQIESGKKTEEVIKAGTGGAFAELVVIFKSLEDVFNVAIKLGVVAGFVERAINKITKQAIDPIFNLVNKIITNFNVGILALVNDGTIKGYKNKWDAIDNLMQSMFNTVIILGLKSIFVIAMNRLVAKSIQVVTDVVMPQFERFVAKLNEKTFTDNVRGASVSLMLVSTSIILFTAAMFTATLVVKEKFADILLGLTELFALFGVVYLFTKFVSKFMSVEDLVKPMSSIAALVGIMLMLSGLLWIISKIDSKQILTSLVGLAGLMVIAIAMISLLKFVQIGVNQVLGGWLDIAKTLGILGLSMIMLAGILYIVDWMFSEISFLSVLKDLFILGGCVLLMIGVLEMLNAFTVTWQMVATMAVIVGTLLLVGTAISIVNNSVNGWEDVVAMTLFGVIMVGLVGLFTAVGTFALSGVGTALIYAAAAVFLAIGATILMVATSIEKVVNSFKTMVELMADEKKMVKALAAIPNVLGAFITAITSINPVSAIAAAKNSIIIATALSPAINTISKMIKVIKDMSTGEFEFNDPDNPGKKKTMNLIEILNGDVLKDLGKHLTLIITGFANAIASVPYDQAVKIIHRTKMMRKLGKMMNPISKMVDTIKNLASGTVDIATERGMKTMNLVELLNGGFGEKITNALTTIITAFAHSISSIKWSECEKVINRKKFMKKLGQVVGPVTDLVEMITSLAGGTIEVDGKQVNLVAWINSNETQISNTLQTIIRSFADAMSMGMGVGDAENWWDDVFEEYMDAAKDGLEEVPDVLDLINDMTSGIDAVLKNIGNLKNNGLDVFSIDIRSCINGMTQWYDTGVAAKLPSMVECTGKLVEMSENIKIITENAQNTDKASFSNFINESDQFVNSINKLNTSKANSLANVLDKLAKLSESLDGNFDKLADAINDKLIGTLGDLAEALDDVSSSNNSIGSKIGGFFGNITNGASNTLSGIFGGSSNSNDALKLRETLQNIEESISAIRKMADTEGLKTRQAPDPIITRAQIRQ